MSSDDQSGDAPPAQSGIWRESLQVHSYDVDFTSHATAEAICRWFLDAAWNHAEQLGFGFKALARQNQFWVLARLLIEFASHPKWGERVYLSTWPRGLAGAIALREFELCDPGGTRLVGGTSGWLVLDASTHRPQRLDKLPFHIPAQVLRQAVGRDPRKLPDFQTGAVTSTANVRYSDIDVNSHMNSARYIGWLQDSYPEEFHRNHQLRTLELNFIGEARWNDCVSVRSHEREPLRFEHLLHNSKGVQVCRAQLDWRVRATDASAVA